jgi:hypothetical protein
MGPYDGFKEFARNPGEGLEDFKSGTKAAAGALGKEAKKVVDDPSIAVNAAKKAGKSIAEGGKGLVGAAQEKIKDLTK